MISEASHYRLFIELAEYYLDKELVKIRWQQWLNHEAEVLQTIELRGDRIH